MATMRNFEKPSGRHQLRVTVYNKGIYLTEEISTDRHQRAEIFQTQQ
jgi:hypothetical protein